MDNMRTCSVIGLLSDRNALMLEEQREYYLLLKSSILELIGMVEGASAVRFSVSMEHGLGLSIAEIILELKNRYQNITLECVIPYETISDKWTISKRDRYFSIMARCDKETLLLKHCTRDYKRRCNSYLIGQSQFILVIDVDQTKYADKIVEKIGNAKRVSRISLQSLLNLDCINA